MTASDRMTRVTQTTVALLCHRNGVGLDQMERDMDKCIAFAKELEARVESALIPNPVKGEPK